jgi:threonine dehydrogenase-like Zn-dependent dehydrogenase
MNFALLDLRSYFFHDPTKLMAQNVTFVHFRDGRCGTIVDDEDVILKVTGSTICGSDLHLLHCT